MTGLWQRATLGLSPRQAALVLAIGVVSVILAALAVWGRRKFNQHRKGLGQ